MRSHFDFLNVFSWLILLSDFYSLNVVDHSQLYFIVLSSIWSCCCLHSTSAVVMKYTSSLAKTYAVSCAIFITGLYNAIVLGEDMRASFWLSAVVVAISVILYNNSPVQLAQQQSTANNSSSSSNPAALLVPVSPTAQSLITVSSSSLGLDAAATPRKVSIALDQMNGNDVSSARDRWALTRFAIVQLLSIVWNGVRHFVLRASSLFIRRWRRRIRVGWARSRSILPFCAFESTSTLANSHFWIDVLFGAHVSRHRLFARARRRTLARSFEFAHVIFRHRSWLAAPHELIEFGRRNKFEWELLALEGIRRIDEVR